MKILSIESPQQLKDRTVKASITVAEENYIPLILLTVKAHKGGAIEINDVDEEDIQKDNPLNLIMEAIKPIIQSQLNIAEKVGYQKAKSIMFGTPELTEDVDIFAFPENKGEKNVENYQKR